MKIIYNEQEYEAEKIVKQGKSVVGYNDGGKVFEIIGIKDGDTIHGEYIEKVTVDERLEALEGAMLDLILRGEG